MCRFISFSVTKISRKHGRNPQGSMSEQDIDDLLELKNEVFETMDISNDLISEDFARCVFKVLLVW